MISTLNSCVGLAEVKTKDSSATFCCNYTTWLLAVTSVTRPELQNTPLLLNSDMTHTETDDSLWPTPIMTTHFSWVVQSVAGNTSFLVSFRFQTCALTEPEKKKWIRGSFIHIKLSLNVFKRTRVQEQKFRIVQNWQTIFSNVFNKKFYWS